MRLYLGDVPILIDPRPIAEHVAHLVPVAMQGAPLDRKERLLRIAAKGFLSLMLDWIDGEIVKKGLPVARPKCPKGADLVSYAIAYLTSYMLAHIQDARFQLTTEANDDGELVITHITALDAPGGALPAPGDRADSPASVAAAG